MSDQGETIQPGQETPQPSQDASQTTPTDSLPPQTPVSQPAAAAPVGATKTPTSKLLPLVTAAAMLVILALVIWSGNVRAEAHRRETLAKAIDAIVVAATPTLLQQRPERSERLIHSIREAGHFASVSLTDGTGLVVATTDARYRGATIEELRRAPTICEVRTVRGKLRAFRAIVVGSNNVIGGVQIDLEP